jgi:hypothetical protein
VQSVDPRIALLVEQDRRLALVGKGTMAMMLAAAEKAGLVPGHTTVTDYGVLHAPTGSVLVNHTAETARDLVRVLDEPDSTRDYTAVTRTRTTYTETTTDWVPLSGPEENHD